METAGWQPGVGARVAGKYILEAPLGAGGMGAVFRARHEVTLHSVAIKFLLDDALGHPEILARFRREASAANRIGHPAFVKVLDLGEEQHRPYLIMELLQGRTLGGLVRGDGPLPVADACKIGRRLAEALSAAHEVGIVHRDLKPENLFLTEQGELKILDLGIAKIVSESHDGIRTQTHAVIGSPHTMSPEQCRGARIDHRSDIYSLAVVVYYLLSGGQYPITGDLPGDIVARQIFAEPRPLHELAPWLPSSLCDAIHRTLQKSPDDRPPTMAAFATLLEPWEHSQISAPADRTITREVPAARSGSLVGEAKPRPLRRHTGLVAAAAIVACVASFGIAWKLRAPAPPPVTSAPLAVAPPPVAPQPVAPLAVAPQPVAAAAVPQTAPADPQPVPRDPSPAAPPHPPRGPPRTAAPARSSPRLPAHRAARSAHSYGCTPSPRSPQAGSSPARSNTPPRSRAARTPPAHRPRR